VKLTTLVEVPPGVVTVTVTVPATPVGEVAVIEVAETTTTFVAELAPNFTAVAPVKSVPVMVTEVPPAAGPLVGLSDVTVGAATYVKLTRLLDVPPGVVTVTFAAPAAPAGALAVIWVVDTKFTVALALPPKFTVVAPETNPVPVMVTDVPPAVDPLVGLNDVTVGAAR